VGVLVFWFWTPGALVVRLDGRGWAGAGCGVGVALAGWLRILESGQPGDACLEGGLP
jgi:hypothetical protein